MLESHECDKVEYALDRLKAFRAEMELMTRDLQSIRPLDEERRAAQGIVRRMMHLERALKRRQVQFATTVKVLDEIGMRAKTKALFG